MQKRAPTLDTALLFELLSQPTAPFRETCVAAVAATFLDRAGIPHFEDPAGNLVIGAESAQRYRALVRRRSPVPLRIFMAHMDHPGYHGQRWLGEDRLQVRWLGGAPVQGLRGARVYVADDTGVLGHARITRSTLTPQRRTLAGAELRLEAPLRGNGRRPGARRLYGGFAFDRPVWRRGRHLHAQAIDDLAGVYTVLTLARRLRWDGARGASHGLGLLTRGEEVGFVGAVAHLNLGWLRDARRPLLAVSLEASRALPGAEIGRGVIVRLGDRRTVFSADPLQALTALAARRLPGRHQRRVMDGGACEASATTAWGLPTVGLSLPLGNYHNQGLEAGQRGPAAEFVAIEDLEAMGELCRALLARGWTWSDPWRPVRRALNENLARYRALL